MQAAFFKMFSKATKTFTASLARETMLRDCLIWLSQKAKTHLVKTLLYQCWYHWFRSIMIRRRIRKRREEMMKRMILSNKTVKRKRDQ